MGPLGAWGAKDGADVIAGIVTCWHAIPSIPRAWATLGTVRRFIQLAQRSTRSIAAAISGAGISNWITITAPPYPGQGDESSGRL